LSTSLAQDSMLYEESFNGDAATRLNRKVPEMSAQNDAWRAHGAWRTDGSIQPSESEQRRNMTAQLPVEFAPGHLYQITAMMTGRRDLNVGLGLVMSPELGWTASNTFANYVRLRGAGSAGPQVVSGGHGVRESLMESSFPVDEAVPLHLELDTREEPWTVSFWVAEGMKQSVPLDDTLREQLLGVGIHVHAPEGLAADQSPKVAEDLRVSVSQ